MNWFETVGRARAAAHMTRLGYLDDEKRLTPEGLNLLRELVSEVTSG